MSTYSNTQSRLDRVAPQLRPAGIHGNFAEATTAELLSSYNPDGRTTPDNIRSFHHRGGDVGEATRSWKLTRDTPVDPNVRHGRRGVASAGGADACLRPEMYADKMTSLVDAQREAQYLSNRRKPLGRAPEPRDPIPVPLHGFGITQDKGESTQSVLAGYRAVDVIHPAGQQLTRNYDWESQGIDPTQHRFGKPSENANGSTAAALRREPATQLTSKLAKDYQSTVEHELGKPKSYGFDDPAEWDEVKRGRVRQPGATGTAASFFQTEQPHVQDVLSAWAETASVGKAGGSGGASSMNGPASATSANAQATDTVGAGDGAVVTTASWKSTRTRYGQLEDDVRAHQLLYPCHYVSLGVESKYFAGGRTLEDIRQLSHKCEFGLTDATIDAVFAEVSRDGKCSIEEFKNYAQAHGYM